jgi:hypothetical protein
MMKRLSVGVVILGVSIACGSSPTTPSPVATPPAPTPPVASTAKVVSVTITQGAGSAVITARAAGFSATQTITINAGYRPRP